MVTTISGSQAVRNLRWAVNLLALLIFAFGLIFSWTSWQAEKVRELQYLSSLAELGEKSLDSYFASIERALDAASQDMVGKNGELDVERTDFLLQRFKKAYPETRIAIVSRPDGQILATTEGTARSALPSLANEPSFARARDAMAKGLRFHIGRPFLGPVSKEWIIPLRYGVHDENGNLIFLVGAGLPLSKPQSFWKDAPLPGGVAMGLVGDDAYLVSRYPVPSDVELGEVYGKARTGNLIHLLRQPVPPKSGFLEVASSVTGVDSFIVFRRLSNYPVTFFAVMPKANVRAAWWRSVRFSYVLMLFIIVAAFAAYRWVLKHQIAWESEREQRLMDMQMANEDLRSFSYSVSHDLRAPLRSIEGFGRILRTDYSEQLDREGRAHLQRIISATARMTELIDDLLSLAQVSRNDILLGQVDLGRLAREIISTHIQAHPDRRVNVVIKPNVLVSADPGLMRIVMENLVGNAWKFTGKVKEAHIELGSTTVAGDTAYFVRDNGAGFDMAHAGRLFNAFQRFHHRNDFEGTGIGLATVRRIIQRHHGKVWIESAVNRGTTVFFTLS